MMVIKGRREQLKSGDEVDTVSRRARRIVPFGRGELRKIKRRMNKRVRREARKSAVQGAVTRPAESRN